VAAESRPRKNKIGLSAAKPIGMVLRNVKPFDRP